MKLTAGIAVMGARNIEKNISKKILLANTTDKLMDRKAKNKVVSSPADPIFFTNGDSMIFNPDIRYRNTFAYSPLTGINYRNDLLLFAENNEIKKAITILSNETVIIDTDAKKYPVYPELNLSLIPLDKQEVAKAIQEYLDNVFFPKLFQYYNFKDDGLIEKVREFLTTGKLAYEIIYDNLKNPHDIIGIVQIDTSTLQKFKELDYVYYVQRPLAGDGKERVLHENQVILIEWNKFDYGYVSYLDRLRKSFNIMRSMQTSKILWFATKSQVRMHIKLAMGDVGRPEAIQKLTESKNQYINQYTFDDDGIVKFNNKPNNSGYREFFTAETNQSGSPEIEEINSNGPDLTEVDSLQYWEKLFWKDTDIPYDRIDPNSQDTWGFTDVNSLRKVEINFSKNINAIRKLMNELFTKPIVIQLTLKEIEIGVDLSLLDSIKAQWIAFNEYDKLAELEVLAKKVELATSISAFGDLEDVNGVTRKMLPITWIIENYFDYSPEQLKGIEAKRKVENVMLGFPPDTTYLIEDEKDDEKEDDTVDDDVVDYDDKELKKNSKTEASNIRNFEDSQYKN